MLRIIICSLITGLFLPAISFEFALAQDRPAIHIDKVHHKSELDKFPHLFDVEGTVTIPPADKMGGTFMILFYTKSDEGGYIQLQMLGSEEDGTRELRSTLLSFDNTISTTNWRKRIWLGSKEEFVASYTIYAVVGYTIDDAEARRIMRLTHNELGEFKDIINILSQTKFQPLVWTDKKEVERYK